MISLIGHWIARLLGRRPKDEGPAEVALSPVRSAAVPSAPTSVVDLKYLAEYDLNLHLPLSPRDAERLGPLRELTCGRFRENARSGLLFPELARRLIRRGGVQKDINGLVQLIQQEPVLSAQILRTANAAVHADRGEARGIRESVMRLGTDVSWQIALASAVLAVTDGEGQALQPHFRDSWHFQWSHAMVVASTAGWLAVNHRVGDVERVFLGGLLHDIGKIFALSSINDLDREGRLNEPLSPPLLEAILDEVHVEIGQELSAHWKLPAYIGAICAAHHDERPDRDAVEVHVVRLASGLDEARRNPRHRDGAVGQARQSAVVLGLNETRLLEIVAQLRREASRQGI